MVVSKLKLFLQFAKEISMVSDSVVSEVANPSWVRFALITQLFNVPKVTNHAQTRRIKKIPFAIRSKTREMLFAPSLILRSLRTLHYPTMSTVCMIKLVTLMPLLQWYTLVTRIICRSLLPKLSRDPAWTRSINRKPLTSYSMVLR